MNEQVGNENEAMKELAESLWKYMEPKVENKMRNSISYYRAQVVTAPADGIVVIQRPFDKVNLSLPYVTSAANLTAGAQVTVMVMGSHSNAIVLGDGTLSNL